jgi:hypothetical protein
MVKKIKICAGYDSSENLINRLIKQFKTPDIDLSNIEFVYDDSYDVIVFFNYINSDIKKGSKSYIIPHEPMWNGSHQKSVQDGTTILGFDKSQYIGNCVDTVSHTFYGGRGPWIDKLDFWSYDNLKISEFNKTKNISSSVTKINVNYGDSCLYPQRYKISNMVDSLPFVDSYYGINSSPERKDSLVDYRFNLAIENGYSDNWISEKFYDCVLTDTIPIYYGCKNIKEIYPEGGYILIDDINNIEKIKELLININENSEKIYSENIESIRKIKKRYFDEYNLLKLIINL